MLELIDSLDRTLFHFCNVTLANPVTDLTMPVVTSDNYLRVLYGLAMLLLLIKGNARLRWLVLFSALTLTLTDQLSAGLLKDFFARLRPCHTLSEINLLVGCGGGKSMPSAHAANAFGQAALFSLTVVRLRWYLWAFAAIVAFSRVMVGVHYPGDILVGAIVGVAIGAGVVWLHGHFETWSAQRRIRKAADTPPVQPAEK